MPEEIKRISLRIPESLHQQLTKIANENKRSINNEILFMIEKAIRKQKISRPINERLDLFSLWPNPQHLASNQLS